MTAERLNHNGQVLEHKTKTMLWKRPKHSAELSWSLTILCGFITTSDTVHVTQVIWHVFHMKVLTGAALKCHITFPELSWYFHKTNSATHFTEFWIRTITERADETRPMNRDQDKRLPLKWGRCESSSGCHPSQAVWAGWGNCGVHWCDQYGQGLDSGESECPSHLSSGCYPSDESHCCQPAWRHDA